MKISPPEIISGNQKGFTLIELLIGIAIAGILASGIAMGIFTIFDINARSNSSMTAVKEVENAIHWITRDTQMAQQVVLDPGNSGFPIVLSWVDWDSNSHSVTYSIVSGELRRIYSLNGDEPTTTVIVNHIDPASLMTNCQLTPGVLTYTITATTGGFRPASETRSFNIILRSNP